MALLDLLTHKIVVDSLKTAGDTLDWPRIDSLYYLVSRSGEAEFDAWYAALSKTERKKYDFEVKEKIKKHIADSCAQRDLQPQGAQGQRQGGHPEDS